MCVCIYTHTHTHISPPRGGFPIGFPWNAWYPPWYPVPTLVRVPPTFVTRIPSSLEFPNVKPSCQIQTSNVILLELFY